MYITKNRNRANKQTNQHFLHSSHTVHIVHSRVSLKGYGNQQSLLLLAFKNPTHFLSNSVEKTDQKMMMNGNKTTPDVGIQMPDLKVATESATMSGPLVSTGGTNTNTHRKTDVVLTTLRFLCLFSSVMAMSLMTTAEEKTTISIYGFHFPVYCKWSFADSFEYLVGMSAAVVAHSLLQLLLSVVKLIKKIPVIPSRNHAWLIFAGDQVFAYAMMSAGSAASGVTNLNRTGIRHSLLPDFCKPLHRFCDRIAISIAFAFFSCFLLAISAVLDVIWLSKY